MTSTAAGPRPPDRRALAPAAAPGNRFDVHDLRAALTGVRSVAMVGNAASILDHDNGALIDAHDLVVRFNRARTEGVEAKIGARTDLLVANAANRLERAPSPAVTLAPAWVLCFVQPEPDQDIAPFRAWVGAIPTVITLSPDIVGFGAAAHTRGLTLGTYTLYLLTRFLAIERLFVTGFSMYGAAGGTAHKYYERRSGRAGGHHDLDEEARLFAAILAAFPGQLQTTPEVAGLLAQYGHARAAPRAGGAGPSLTDRLLARFAWQLLRMGFKLRRRIEHGGAVQFDGLRK